MINVNISKLILISYKFFDWQVHFEEVIGEPDGVRSIDCVWRNSWKCFRGTLNCCYVFLTVLCAIPISFCWGCEFACLACYHIWYVTPAIRIWAIDLLACRNFVRLVLDACVGPCCETLGLCLSKIIVSEKKA